MDRLSRFERRPLRPSRFSFCGWLEGHMLTGDELILTLVYRGLQIKCATFEVCVVFLDTLTPEFELYVQLRERRQRRDRGAWSEEEVDIPT
ncbi:hypothetical protein Taro_003699 [Colocasia esculenta]|uniref:Uncharacterized protein n=1 Tax=Colocasia esculenta TaxID=4460 RepID=A0A843TK39_COLES|nr:hypothetical protein [Colocasia esculenta]